MSLPVVLLSVLLAIAVIVCVLLAIRLSQVRNAGTPVLLRRVPAEVDRGWRHGQVHYRDNALHYYRLTSVRPGPNLTLARQGIEISGRRPPVGTEAEILDGMVILQVHSGLEDRHYELAMGPDAVTAFQSWLESRQNVRSQRRKSARKSA